jgi:CBS domain-containing protein
MTTIKHILEGKESRVWSVSPDSNVFDALKMMSDRNVGALLVLENDELVGIISERDYARKVVLLGKSSKDCLVSDIMTAKVIYLRLDQTAQDCMALMTDKRIRHMPVFEDKKLVGIISIGDLVKAIISDQQFTIQQLVNYISGVSA